MELSQLVAFWAVSVMFIIIPGSDWAYVISAGVNGRSVVPAITGLLSGHLIAILVVAAGVGALLGSTPEAMTAITVAGALYLLWLGVSIIKSPSGPTVGEGQSSEASVRWFSRGLGISFLNPKLYLFFFALMPQFTRITAAWPVSVQIVLLGVLHLLSCFTIYALVGFGSGAILQTRPRAARIVSQVSGVIMIGLAVFLLTEQFM